MQFMEINTQLEMLYFLTILDSLVLIMKITLKMLDIGLNKGYLNLGLIMCLRPVLQPLITLNGEDTTNQWVNNQIISINMLNLLPRDYKMFKMVKLKEF